MDYSVPIVRRYRKLVYSSDSFFNLCLITASLLPVSTFFYLLYKKTMGFPGLVRRTIFWRNRSPTMVSVITGLVFIILLGSLVGLNIEGRESSNNCTETSIYVMHGYLLPNDAGYGSKLECHGTYIPYPAPVIYCRSFFGQEGKLDIWPLYNDEVTGGTINFTDMTTVACKKFIPTSSCNSSEAMCNPISLPNTTVSHGSWQCTETVCALFCETGYLSTGAPFLCTGRNPVPPHYCHPASLVVTNNTHTFKPIFVHDDDDDDVYVDDSTCTWEHETSLADDPVFLCKTPADVLGNDCLVLNMSEQNKISFKSLEYAETWYTLVSYKYSTGWLPQQFSHKTVTSSELSVQRDKDCVVKISHDTLMIIGNETFLIKYTSPTMTYWKLDPLHTPRHYHACALLGQGLVLVAGGKDASDKGVLQSEMININAENGKKAGKWRKVGNVSAERVQGRILTVDGGCTLLVGGSGKGEDREHLSVEKFYLYQGEENGRWTEVSVDNSTWGNKSVDWSVHICGDVCTGPDEEITFNLNDLTTTKPNFLMHVKDHVNSTDYGRDSASTSELGFKLPSIALATETTTIFTLDLEDIDISTRESASSELGSTRPSKVLETEVTTIFTIDLDDIDLHTTESPSTSVPSGISSEYPKFTQYNKDEGDNVSTGSEEDLSTTRYGQETTILSELVLTQPIYDLAIKETTEGIILTVDLEDLYTTESPTIVSPGPSLQNLKVIQHKKAQSQRNSFSMEIEELQSTTKYRRESTSNSESIFTQPIDDLATTEGRIFTDLEDLHTTESPAITELASFPVVPSQSTIKDSQHTDDSIEDLIGIETEDGETTTEYKRERESTRPTISLLPDSMSATLSNELVFFTLPNDNDVSPTEATTVFMFEIDLAELKTTKSPVQCNGDYCSLPS